MATFRSKAFIIGHLQIKCLDVGIIQRGKTSDLALTFRQEGVQCRPAQEQYYLGIYQPGSKSPYLNTMISPIHLFLFLGPLLVVVFYFLDWEMYFILGGQSVLLNWSNWFRFPLLAQTLSWHVIFIPVDPQGYCRMTE